MNPEAPDVQLMSRTGGNGAELIDSVELAARWRVPESWIRNHTRARTPKDERIPCIRLGRYVRMRACAARTVQEHREDLRAVYPQLRTINKLVREILALKAVRT